MASVTPQQVKTVETTVKNGVKTTEFYLSLLVTIGGGFIQFLPSDKADAAVKVMGLIASVLAALGYTASRTVTKASQGTTISTNGLATPVVVNDVTPVEQ